MSQWIPEFLKIKSLYKKDLFIYDDGMLSKSDVKLIRDLFSEEFSKKFSDSFNESFTEVRKTLKDDILTFKDQILSEIQKLRDDVSVITGYKDQIEDHETRIEKLENVLQP